MKHLPLLFIFLFSTLLAKSPAELHTLYRSIDPDSIEKQLAFYHLYPETEEGKISLQRSWELLSKHHPQVDFSKSSFNLPEVNLSSLIFFMNPTPDLPKIALTDQELAFIEALAAFLPHHELKGHKITTSDDLSSLSSEEIDLAHSIFLYQFDNDARKVREYEASVDLIALKILARLPEKASNLAKIEAINQCIFHEMGFRFPPHSLWAKDVDIYTFLPSVLDSRQGVCLGVSILYLSLAQRLELPLEIITPPGHIYISYVDGDFVKNIETTARGVHIPTSQYFGINSKSLTKHEMKGVIGLHFQNEAAVQITKKNYTKSVELYQKAALYLPDDLLVKRFLAFSLLLDGKSKEGLRLLKEVSQSADPSQYFQDTLVQDLLLGKADPSSIEAILEEVDETKASIKEKQEKLSKALIKHPNCYDLWFQMGITHMQLSRVKEAQDCFSRCYKIHPEDPNLNYYLVILSMQRFSYPEAERYLSQLSSLIIDHPRKRDLLLPFTLDLQLNYLHPLSK